MRDEERVDVVERADVGLPDDAPQVQHPPAQDGVGEQPDAVELEQDRAVADPRDRRSLHLHTVMQPPRSGQGVTPME